MNIYDIAQRSGVSIATVSRVLNNKGNVSEKSREKVLRVMGECGYEPNAFARGLGLGTMKMVGILCADVSDPFYARALSTLESGLRDMGYDLILYCTGYRSEDKRRYTQLLCSKRVDAIILIGSVFADEADMQTSSDVPVVIVNGTLPGENVYSVVSNDEDAFCAAVKSLFNGGARNILYVYDSLTSAGKRKLAGYKKGLKLCGMAERRELMLKTDRDIDTAIAGIKALRECGVSFDAALCSEDIFAVAVQKAVAVPVIGCNNSIISKCASPAVTSIDLMLDTMCTTAINILNDVLEGRNAPAKVVISSQLVERESFISDKE